MIRQMCQFDMYGDNHVLRDQFINRERFDKWAKTYILALSEQGISQSLMKKSNPNIVLRNYLAQQVIDRAEGGKFEMFHQFLAALKKPYEEIEEYQKFSSPPPDWGKHLEISCSS